MHIQQLRGLRNWPSTCAPSNVHPFDQAKTKGRTTLVTWVVSRVFVVCHSANRDILPPIPRAHCTCSSVRESTGVYVRLRSENDRSRMQTDKETDVKRQSLLVLYPESTIRRLDQHLWGSISGWTLYRPFAMERNGVVPSTQHNQVKVGAGVAQHV